MGKKQKTQAAPAKMGRPRIEFKPEYCDLLIRHMKEGGDLKSFGSKIPCSEDTVRRWLGDEPDFSMARKEGFSFLEAFYQNLGKTMASGQLRRLVSEKPMVGTDGKPMLDPNNGQVLYHREYEHVNGNATAWIFLTKNILGWRDKKDIELSGKDGGPLNFADVSEDELKSELKKLVAEAKKVI